MQANECTSKHTHDDDEDDTGVQLIASEPDEEHESHDYAGTQRDVVDTYDVGQIWSKSASEPASV